MQSFISLIIRKKERYFELLVNLFMHAKREFFLQKIPNKFTREYGVNLSNPVFLKPPDGIEWKIFWTKHDDDIWFQKGWKEFATYYSLSHKYLVLFKYQETSHLEVHIFDQSALEVDYPFCGIKIEHENLDHVSNDSVEVSDDSIEVLDELTPSQKKTRLKSTSCSRPRKKLNTGPSEVFEESSNLPQHVQIKGEQSQGTNLGMSSDKQVLDGMNFMIRLSFSFHALVGFEAKFSGHTMLFNV